MSQQLHPRVGVGAFILNGQGELLLVQRKKAPEQGHWSLPGGKVEWMETAEDTVIREIEEEVGLEIELTSLLCVTNHILPDEEAHWVCPTYIAKVKNGIAENREQHAISEIGWFSLERLPKRLTLTLQNALKEYEKLK
ncbi:NUDIX domain-containing protein [Bacillus cereus]|uniref:NUDIX domain-containing protein n=1 Tax=unclassified Bacillus (in: firmicutes) TaxID=185979 RepID=UPI00047B9771|nr:MULTISPECIES: NUDIX domain-containing protein [unclassified Bacillus (in: firmicutes)]PFE06241.1 NUDIX domain-containing protein [Bacillus sp. AFS023182]PGY01211.1 NUDIX domain-containing protein [Bacillus cereus]SDZ15083.1 mutator mutT protein [Bacillus sp. 166amftsu]